MQTGYNPTQAPAPMGFNPSQPPATHYAPPQQDFHQPKPQTPAPVMRGPPAGGAPP